MADRLSQGKREHADLVWLRAMRNALKEVEAHYDVIVFDAPSIRILPTCGLPVR